MENTNDFAILHMCKASNYIYTIHSLQLPTRLENTSGFSPKVFSHQCRCPTERSFWWSSSFGNVTPAAASFTWQEVVWLKRLLLETKTCPSCNFMITHLSDYIGAFRCSLHHLLLRKGTNWDASQQMDSEKRDPTGLGRLQQSRQIYSSLSCCSSTKYIRERSWCTVCTWKKPLLMRAVSTSACINEHDGETTELITSFCS